MIELRQLTLSDEKAFYEGLELFTGEDPHWYSFLWNDLQDYKKMLQILRNEHFGGILKIPFKILITAKMYEDIGSKPK